MTGTLGVVGCTTHTAHGRDQFRRLAAEAAGRGVRLVGIDLADALASGADRVDADRYVPLAALDEDGLAAAVEELSEVDAFLTTREAFVPLTARLAALTATPGNDAAAVETMRHKDRCRTALAAAGLAQPPFVLVEEGAVLDAAGLPARLGAPPWVVKPQIGTGSQGVVRVDDAAAAGAAVQALAGARLVEAFVRGRELSVEGVLVGGRLEVLTVTDKTTGASFVESAHRAPAALDEELRARIGVDVAAAVAALGLTHGIVHVELWVTDDGATVLGEAHARPGGDFIHALVEETRPGLELYGMLVDDLLGRPVRPVPPQTRWAGVRFLLLPPGVVADVETSADPDPRIIASALEIHPGSVIGPVEASSDRSGVFVAVADDAGAVEATLASAASGVRVRWVEP